MKRADSSTVWIERSGGEGSIRARIFRPKTVTKPLPIALYLHGGGYALGVPEQSHALHRLRRCMDAHDCVFVCPAYRLSMEAPYPAALHDCYDTLRWIKEHAKDLGGNPDQIFVMGGSAGGGLTVATCMLARDKGEVNVAFQMPLYPMIDDRHTNPSSINNQMPVWNTRHNKIAWDLYLQSLKEQNQEIPIYAAPARANNYKDLPPAATFVGDLDPFLDETQQYIQNLQDAGVTAECKVFEGCYHGFDQLVPKADISRAAIQYMMDRFAHAAEHYFAPQNSEDSSASG